MLNRLNKVFHIIYVLLKYFGVLLTFSLFSSLSSATHIGEIEDYRILSFSVLGVLVVLSLIEWIIKGKLIWK